MVLEMIIYICTYLYMYMYMYGEREREREREREEGKFDARMIMPTATYCDHFGCQVRKFDARKTSY